MNNFITLGRIARAHGIKGEVRVDYYADSLLLLKAKLFVQLQEKEMIPVTIQSKKQADNQVIIKFKEVNDRNMAETWKSGKLLISKEERNKILASQKPKVLLEENPILDKPLEVVVQTVEELAESDVFLDDLIGLKVFLEEEQIPMGTLVQVDIITGQEIWTIQSPEKEVLFPAVPEFVQEINLEKGFVRISPPPGLFELY